MQMLLSFFSEKRIFFVYFRLRGWMLGDDINICCRRCVLFLVCDFFSASFFRWNPFELSDHFSSSSSDIHFVVEKSIFLSFDSPVLLTK